MSAVVEDKDALRSSFERFAAAHAASDPAWLRDRRTAAFARYVEKGLPGPRDESWRHTPVAPLTKILTARSPRSARRGCLRDLRAR